MRPGEPLILWDWTFKHLPDLFATDSLDGIQHIASVDSITCNLITADINTKVRQPTRLLRLYVGCAFDLRNNTDNLVGLLAKHVEVAAVKRDSNIRANTGNQLLHSQFDRLRIAKNIAWYVVFESLIESFY